MIVDGGSSEVKSYPYDLVASSIQIAGPCQSELQAGSAGLILCVSDAAAGMHECRIHPSAMHVYRVPAHDPSPDM